jgi:predicted metal-dependent HD superfamily phosphohydrolase
LGQSLLLMRSRYVSTLKLFVGREVFSLTDQQHALVLFYTAINEQQKNMDYNEILKKVQRYVEDFFESNANHKLAFHNKKHTERVVSAVAKIAAHYNLNSHDFFVVTAAAWFHDLGYYMVGDAAHEASGAAAATSFLKDTGVDETTILAISNCIVATKMPQTPTNLLEEIVCDADLFHLGTDEFAEFNKLMRKEHELQSGKTIDKAEWRKGTISLLKSHHFHTSYCQLLLNPKKNENLERLLNKEKKLAGDETLTENIKATAAESKEVIKEKKTEKPVRGIETMFRVASTNHQRLSDMADSKSHIMISVNSIIISVVIGLVIRKLETDSSLVIPTLILLTGCVIAVIFSVLATRPKIPNGSFAPEELANKTVNLLFFGNFYKMDYNHYYDGMKQVMNDGEFLYASLIKDIHSQGVVLGQKYKLLRISYTIFMFTLIISVVAFAVSIIFFQ